MIKYDLTNINKWYNGSRNIVKCYHGTTNAFDLTGGGAPVPPTPTGQTPCYAVTDNIAQYQSTDFVDVYDTTADKWYKLNNLNEYEEYGIYGSGRTNTTYYEGKLTIDNGYEYIYSGNSWVNLGEVSGSTATLPNVPFTVNYNAKNYNPSTYTIPMTDGQLNNMDAVITGNTNLIVDHHEDGYIELTGSTSAVLRANISNSSVNQYFNRDSNNPNLTIIAKAYTPGSSTEGSIIVNRDSKHNWMYRHKSARLTLHGASEQGYIAVSNTVPNICSARIDSNRQLTYNNYTQGTTSTTGAPFTYGSNTTSGATLFAGYSSSSGEQWKGVFYWVYMSQNTLTDEQVQQVIDYNEGNGCSPTYPEYYDEIADPPTSVTFATMADALAYQCPYVGLRATIAGDNYVFNSNYEWEEVTSRLPQGYTEVEYIQNTGTSTSNGAYINSGLKLYDVVGNSFSLSGRVKSEFYSASGYDDLETILNSEDVSSPYYGFAYRYVHTHVIELTCNPSNSVTLSSTANTDGSNDILINCASTTVTTQVPLGLFASYNGNYTTPYRFAKATIYSLTVVKNGVTVRDFVPAKRDSDSKYGLYDLITDTFYTSPNGNNFSGGEPV